MSQIPPNVKLEDALTVCVSEDGRNAGGRPQSPVRSWFIEHHINPNLSGKELHEISNIANYQCPGCQKLMRSTHINYLKRHVLDCALFPKKHKGMYFVYILYMIQQHTNANTNTHCIRCKPIFVCLCSYTEWLKNTNQS